MKTNFFLAVLGAGATALAHMDMSSPPALRHKLNPYNGGDIDYSINSPILLGQFPCRNDLGLLGTPKATPVAEYRAGQRYSATLSGSATHGGGSCQFSLSYDNGLTWTVIQSIIGGCPMYDGHTFDFTIPSDAPSSDAALFSWSWINKIGNREFYQNCAVVKISGGSGQATVPFSSRPEIFIANIIQGCMTPEGTDVLYPNPGPDVVYNVPNPSPPVGNNCGPSGIPGPGNGHEVETTTSTSKPAPTSAPATTSSAAPVVTPTTTLVTSTSKAPVETSAPAEGAFTGPCSQDGAWNCVDGTAFQRCASGLWSATVPLAGNQKCQPGVADTLVMVKRALRFRREEN